MVSTIDPHDSTAVLLNYMFNKPGFALVFSTLFANDLGSMIKEIDGRMSLNTNPGCKTMIVHIIHSLHKDDKVGLDAWKEQCENTVQMYGKGRSVKSVAGMHEDTDELHCHQLLCLVLPDGKLCDRVNEKYRMRRIDLGFEKKYNTTPTRDRDREKLERELAEKAYEKDGILPPDNIRIHTLPLKQGEIETARRLEAEGLKDDPVPDRLHLQKDIEALVYDCSSWDEFKAKAAAKGIEVRPWTDKDGVTTGVSFAHGDVKLKGSGFGLDGRTLTRIFNKKQFAAETDRFDGERFGHGYVPANPAQEILISKIGSVAYKATTMSDFERGLEVAGIPYRWKYSKEGKRTNIEYGEGDTQMTGTNAGYNVGQIQAIVENNFNNQPKKQNERTGHERGTAKGIEPLFESNGTSERNSDDFLNRHGGTDDWTPKGTRSGIAINVPENVKGDGRTSRTERTNRNRADRTASCAAITDAQRTTRRRVHAASEKLQGFDALIVQVGSALVALLRVLNRMQVDTQAPRPSRPMRPVRPRPPYQPPRRPRPGHAI